MFLLICDNFLNRNKILRKMNYQIHGDPHLVFCKKSHLDFVNMIKYILLIIVIEFDSFLSEIILSDNFILICIWIAWMKAFDFDKITLFDG